jgi:hypothetical protein
MVLHAGSPSSSGNAAHVLLPSDVTEARNHFNVLYGYEHTNRKFMVAKVQYFI